MKKISLIIVMIFAFGFVNAQKAKFGLKAGLNIANANISGDGIPKTKSVTSFQVGFFTEINISKKFAFQPELLYSMQGTNFDLPVEVNGSIYNTNDTYKLSYINVPLMFKFYPEEKFYLEAGPQIGFLTSSKLEVEVIGYGSQTQDAKELFKSVDFGLNLGLGYNFSKRVTSNFRYNLGLSNIAETEPGDNTKIKNSVISISLGYIF